MTQLFTEKSSKGLQRTSETNKLAQQDCSIKGQSVKEKKIYKLITNIAS